MNLAARFRRSFTVSTVRRGLWDDNPVALQVLGICSALAVTSLVANTLVMCAGLVLTTAFSSATVSALRAHTPHRVRMMVQVLVIAGYVMAVELLIRAYLPDIGEALGPYVGLIITNCIVMGRCEAYATKNPPWPSFLDGLGNGLGYSGVLLFIATAREVLGMGTFLGVTVLPGAVPRLTLLAMPPGAFFMLALTIWLVRGLVPRRT